MTKHKTVTEIMEKKKSLITKHKEIKVANENNRLVEGFMHCRIGLRDCTSWPRQTNEERKLIHERGRRLKFTGRWEDLNGGGSEMESVNKESLKLNTTYT